MGERWVKEAEQLHGSGSSGQMLGNHNNPKVTWHVTVSGSGSAAFDACHRYLGQVKSEPHFLYDPLTDRLGQWFPLDRSSRALRNDGSTPTNRDGSINIQIEVVGQPDGFTRYWRPGKNFAAMMRAIRSWDIPDVWPAGQVSQTAYDNKPRRWSDYRKPGHFGHSQVPGNDHWDPGPIDQVALLKAAPGGSKPSTSKPSKPASSYYTPEGDYSVRKIQKIVRVEVDGWYGDDTRAAVRRLQRDLGVTADGWWGEVTETAYERSLKPKPKPGAALIRRGSRGSDVKEIQRGLNRVFPSYSRLTVDGIFGPATERVVREFQQRSGLASDGVVGPKTRRELAKYGIGV